MKKVIYLTLLYIIFLLPSFTAYAKGPADKISISGPGLSGAIEITDPQTLQQFSPWDNNFFDIQRGILAEPPKTNRLYQVLFYLKDSDGTLHIRYAFQYAPGQPGYIYLPGRNDELFKLNTIILRDGLDGHWIYASQAWGDLMQHLLEENGNSVSNFTQGSGNARLFTQSIRLIFGAVVILAVVLLLTIRRGWKRIT